MSPIEKRVALMNWLRRNAPGDILMPVGSNKAPMFKHANGEWSWHRYMRMAHDPERNVGILLRDLCVVDVDCKAICGELCRRFPILLETARETTRKGMHFFFRRSVRANTHGYYDGACQRLASVDFKTVSSNGTSGFLVVAPSTDKRWVVAPWDLADLPEIPDDLLTAIAKPRHRAVTATMKMVQTGETVEFDDSVGLGRLVYTEMFDGMPVIPVPVGDAASLKALLKAMETGRTGPSIVAYDWASSIKSMLHLADFLGLRVDDTRALAMRAFETMRLWTAYPSVAAVMERDESEPLLDVETYTAGATRRVLHLGTDAVLLARPLGLDHGDAIIEPDFVDLLEESLPSTLRLLMIQFQSRLIIAGGYVTGEVAPVYGGGNDIDLFVTGCNADEANEIVETFITNEDVRPVFRTGNAVTFRLEGDDPDSIPIQIVLTLYADPAAVLHGFDLDPCRACAYYDGDRLRVMASASWLHAITTASYPIRSERWTMSSTSRIIKYTVKGFQAYLPGIDRDMVPNGGQSVMEFVHAMETCAGVSELVHAERAFAQQNVGPEHLTYTNQGCLTSFIRFSKRHDYDVPSFSTKFINSLRYLYQVGVPLLGMGTARGSKTGHVHLEAGMAAALLTWKAPVAGTGLNAFFPAAAHLDSVTALDEW